MSSFRDRVLTKLSSADTLLPLLLPAADPDRTGLRTALAACYDLANLRIDRVLDATVRDITIEHPLLPTGRHSGTWTQTMPQYTRTELAIDSTRPADVVWVDLLVRLDVQVVSQLDPAGVEAVLVSAFDTFQTLDEFRARFRFIDLEAFMAAQAITTVEQLRDRFDYLVTEIRLRQPAPFDPDDPANRHRLAVTLAVLALDPLDLAEGLRAARLVQRAARELATPAAADSAAEMIAPYSVAVALPAADLPGAGLDSAGVQALYARAGVLSLFLDPP